MITNSLLMKNICEDGERIVREFGFMGDEENPVELTSLPSGHIKGMRDWYKDDKRVHSLVRHRLEHAHVDGKCAKKRTGTFCS